MSKNKTIGMNVRVRYRDGAWYPAIILRIDRDKFVVRWDPPDPNLPQTYIADGDDVR